MLTQGTQFRLSILRVVLHASAAFLWLLGLAVTSQAQTPSAAIGGAVTDATGASIPEAKVAINDPETGLKRSVLTTIEGTYHIAGLPAGTYTVVVEAPGFRPLDAKVRVETGATTPFSPRMELGATSERVHVEELTPQINPEGHKIDSVVRREQIDALPLNGRDFLNLAMLAPGVTAAPTSGGQYNRQFDISVLGTDHRRTRVTVDGGDVLDNVTGGTGQNFSQEVIQEFQISTVNPDLSTGVTGAGAVNIVTRSGSNNLHGSGFYFFRDHNMSAYPGLSRDPSNPDPFFARRQGGFYVGGPIRANRIFFFTNLERNNQDAVFSVQPRAIEFAKFGRIAPSPFNGRQVSARFDFHLNRNNTAFARYSHDGNDTFAPLGAASLPSNWRGNKNWSDQSIAGITTVLRPTLLNDLRFSYTYWSNRSLHPTAADCGECTGLGLPQIDVLGTGFLIGNTVNAPQGRDLRRYDTTDNLTWQKGAHTMRFGFEWEHYHGAGFWAFLEPAAMVLYSPQIVQLYNSDPRVPPAARIPLPASFDTAADILRLPLAGFSTGIGDPSQPPPFRFDQANQSNRWRFYWQDTWRATSRLTLNYGLSYTYETNLLNHDLNKPEYLAPVLGAGGLAPSRKDPNNWGPSAGLAWKVSGDNKTVIRAGAGIYYDTHLFVTRLKERSLLGPLGNGRLPVPGSLVPNPIPNLPGVPLGQPLSFTSGPTAFTGAHLMAILPAVRAGLAQALGNTFNTDLSVRNIELAKSGTDLIAGDFTTPYSEHFNIGVQRELTHGFVVSADFVFRQFMHENMDNIDYNRWDSVRGPVMPACAGLQAADLRARCSAGPIEVLSTGGRSHYKALLVKVDKRFSRHFQVLGSYALASNAGFNTSVGGETRLLNKDNWFENYGPLENDRRHVLNVSGIVQLPHGFQVGFISSMASRAPFSSWISAMDFNGDGSNNDLLPGTRINQLSRGLGSSDLRGLVDTFNQTLAGTRTTRGQLIPRIALPANYEFGDNFFSQDLRVSKTFGFIRIFGEPIVKMTVFGEAFNVLNIANLSGYGGNLAETATFGQPSNRVTQVFGSGGPRAFQFGVRLTF